jgi:hypothetical protein
MSELKSDRPALVRNANDDPFYVNLGDKGAFVTFNIIKTLLSSGRDMPTFTKEANAKKVGGLTAGIGAGSSEPDRLSAARAYAASFEHNGASKAAQAGARWLREPVPKNGQQENEILTKLIGVSDHEEIVQNPVNVPPFVNYNAMIESVGENDRIEWGFGVTDQNRDMFLLISNVVKMEKNEWVLCGYGGKSLGFNESEGDFDFLLANRDEKVDKNEIITQLTKLSTTRTVVRRDAKWGTLIKLSDVGLKGNSFNVDIVFPVHGLADMRAKTHATLFWMRVLGKDDQGFARRFFCLLRRKARNSGLINPFNGGINMWSFMIKGLEFLYENGVLTIDGESCLGRQRPLVDQSPGLDVPECVKRCLVDYAVVLGSETRVLGTFSRTSAHKEREKSEFRMCKDECVMRDPFAPNGTNIVKHIRKTTRQAIILGLIHIAACDEAGHPWPQIINGIEETSPINFDFLPNLAPSALMPSCKIIHVKNAYIASMLPLYGIGIGKDTSEARSRCIRNSALIKDRLTLQLGPAFLEEAAKIFSGTWMIERMDRIYMRLTTVEDEVKNIKYIVEAGLCSQDTFGEENLERCNRYAVEVIFGLMCSMTEYQMQMESEFS